MQESIGPDNIPGYDKVHALAKFLVDLTDKENKVITCTNASTIIALWNDLDPFDKRPTIYAPLHSRELVKGRLKNPKSFRTLYLGYTVSGGIYLLFSKELKL